MSYQNHTGILRNRFAKGSNLFKFWPKKTEGIVPEFCFRLHFWQNSDADKHQRNWHLGLCSFNYRLFFGTFQFFGSNFFREADDSLILQEFKLEFWSIPGIAKFTK